MHHRHPSFHRRGSVLLIVLVVVALLALGAYTFAEFMLVESRASATYGREVQARALADSGVEMAASLLAKRYEEHPDSYYSNPQWFSAVLVRDAASPKGKGRFSVVSAAESDTSGRTIRFGLFDESAKLNLNTLSTWINAKTITAAQAETMLMGLSPDITVDIADAILDWLDSDQTSMQNGAELDYYQGLTPPYATKDNLLDSLDELLLVRGVTPQILFGEDANHNGVLDAEENDGMLDNGDGMLQRGLSTFLTVYSREINLRIDGTPRFNVNGSDMQALYDAVAAEFDAKTATFFVAYRMFGPAGGAGGGNSAGGSGGNSAGGNAGGTGAASSGGNNTSSKNATGGSTGSGATGATGATGASSAGGTGASGTSSAGTSGSNMSTSSQSGSSSGGTGSSGSGKSATPSQNTVAGIDVSKGPTYTIKSLYEFFGAKTSGLINGATNQLSSPWSSSNTDLQTNVSHVLEALTLTDNPYIPGRINVNLAPREILAGLPAPMTPAIADSIFGSQVKPTSGQSSSSSESADRLTTAWLVLSGILTINQLEQLDPFITARGDVFHMQSVGFFDGGGPMARVEAVIDATQTPPQVIFMRDLTELGRGFSQTLLTTGSGSTR
jgi:hypothetical protein